jgi:3-methylcrotonyl-CoA carboxylase alpha subunit
VFKTILIANRGEIACRIAATARKLGIKTIAVYSDADAQAKHVTQCDVAVRIGEAPVLQSYLKGDAILAVAQQHGAQAIHPGYGFLSENEGFALACTQAGLTFVGPPAAAIAAMGSKSAAKTLMAKAGVPLVPGYHGENQETAFLRQQADALGYPVLIKASAGGGGKGMRVVEASQDFEAALVSCQREARASFGDDRVLIERYLQKPRHIEIQVFADTHGNCVYVFERDCSVQRRHQKVLEEAPAPNMDPKMRRAMGEAAVAAAKAVAYVGAGTVEFIVEPDGRFYFMEMNTRLQVEHPVTELITGIDLVEWQLRVAAGEPLPLSQEQLQLSGHAIEARIYAENTENGFLPSVGRLMHVQFPEHVAFAHGVVRVDGGVRCGDDISPYYDPMIAKLIVWGATREQALARMQQALAETQIVGVHTNVNFLSRLIADDSFALADLDTGLIERRRETLLPPAKPSADYVLACAVAAVLSKESAERSFQTQHQQTTGDPWSIQDGWRLNGAYRRRFMWLDGQTPRRVDLLGRVGHQRLEIDGRSHDVGWSGQRLTSGAYLLELRLGGVRRAATVQKQGERVDVFVEGTHTMLSLQDPLQQALHKEAGQTGDLTAPMPGKIIAVHVTAGQTVRQGDALLVMEAMKMEHAVIAPVDGVVKEVFYGVGEQVSEGVALIGLT